MGDVLADGSGRLDDPGDLGPLGGVSLRLSDAEGFPCVDDALLVGDVVGTLRGDAVAPDAKADESGDSERDPDPAGDGLEEAAAND
jgi:hypothetical protein